MRAAERRPNGTDFAVPELYVTGARAGVAIRVGELRSVAEEDLANASTDCP
jgi:hypothetical protein